MRTSTPRRLSIASYLHTLARRRSTQEKRRVFKHYSQKFKELCRRYISCISQAVPHPTKHSKSSRNSYHHQWSLDTSILTVNIEHSFKRSLKAILSNNSYRNGNGYSLKHKRFSIQTSIPLPHASISSRVLTLSTQVGLE